ncbi:MAG: hypothetical protein ACSHXI_04875 [Hoeflea sp.]
MVAGASMGLGLLMDGTPFSFIADWMATDTKSWRGLSYCMSRSSGFF